MKILIADDSATSSTLLERTLQKWGHTVLVCGDGDQAWEMLQGEDRPTIAILDWMMPGLTGPEICSKVRAQARDDYVFILLLTSRTSRNDLIAGMDAGADDYLTKPCYPRELEVRLRAGIRIQELQGQLREQNRAIKHGMEELARSNQALEQFAYIASHDLQEPLRMVKGYVDLLARRYRGKLDAAADDFIKYAVDGVERMQNLIRGLLQFARVQAAQPVFSPVSCDMALNDALANLEAVIGDSGARIFHEQTLPIVSGDQQQITQVFQNLISNAIKFRRDVPVQIHITARRDDGRWIISVQDNGVGIQPKDAERIFNLFDRGTSGTRAAGIGIGLALCKQIVAHHKGDIRAESRADDTPGAVIRFSLPSTE